jgi:hypothetical protein
MLFTPTRPSPPGILAREVQEIVIIPMLPYDAGCLPLLAKAGKRKKTMTILTE